MAVDRQRDGRQRLDARRAVRDTRDRQREAATVEQAGQAREHSNGPLCGPGAWFFGAGKRGVDRCAIERRRKQLDEVVDVTAQERAAA